MAHQDYVKRPKSSNKKNSPYKKKSKQPNDSVGVSLKTKIIGLFTIILIGAFSYGLWSIKDQTVENNMQETSTPVASPKDKVKLQEPPKEKWQYREELASKEVEEGQYEVVDKGPYKMQCGSFRKKEQAEVMKAKIAFSGITSQVVESNGSNGTWFKVVLGPYERKRVAEKDKHKLRRNKITTCQIWLWR
mgnify:CR=1 FL=1